MIRLNKTQLAGKVKFITDYINASNAADGSTVDPNSNVATKNIATMSAEINKDINIQIKRQLIYSKLVEIFGQEQADKYIDQLEKHEIYAQLTGRVKFITDYINASNAADGRIS